jgi:hypothetical protein
LRRERPQSPRNEADADHVRAKTEMLQLRLMEKRHELVRWEDDCGRLQLKDHSSIWIGTISLSWLQSLRFSA